MGGRILVTGCTGLLGSNLCFCLKGDYDIVGLSRSAFSMPGVRHIAGSFMDADLMERVFKEERIAYVIHCAAMTNVDECERKPQEAIEVNFESAICLARLAERAGARFVFISTDAVFDGRKESPYVEDDEVSPVNVYGESKVRAEKALLSEIESCLILRTNMYGFNYREKMSLAEWVLASLRQGKHLTMFDDVKFSAMNATDIAVAVGKLLDVGTSGLYHLASRDSLTKYQFGVAIAEAAGLHGDIAPVSVDEFGFTAARSKNMALSSAKIKCALGEEMPSMQEGVKKFLRLEREGYGKELRSEQ